MNKEQAANIFNETDTDVYTSLQDAFIAGATWQEQHTHPHSTYMEFAEWCGWQMLYSTLVYLTKPCAWEYNGATYTTPELFQYWIDNVKNKG